MPFLARLLLPLILFLSFAGMSRAADTAEIDALWHSLGMRDVIEIMKEEGTAYGAELDASMLAGQGRDGWSALVQQIYDVDRMEDAALARFHGAMAGQDISPLTAFFEGELGQRIVGLEISARRALLDPEVEAISHDKLSAMDEDDDPRLTLLDEFIEVNDLVETNVVGGLNASYAFYTGLAAGGSLSDEMGERDILSDVWAQEDQVRDDTIEWVFSFLAMAYQPLSDAELQAYIDMSKTPAGQMMNTAIFAAFDEVFVDISKALGLGVAQFMLGEEL